MANTEVALTPYLCVQNSDQAIAFWTRAFGAVQTARMADDDGRVIHAEINIHGARVLVSDEHPEINVFSPHTLNGSPVMLVLTVPDVDSLFDQAIQAGAKADRLPGNSPGGSLRTAKLIDPFGHRWMLVTNFR